MDDKFKIGDALYCIKDGFTARNNEQFCTSGKHYVIIKVCSWSGIYTIYDNRWHRHSFSPVNEWFKKMSGFEPIKNLKKHKMI